MLWSLYDYCYCRFVNGLFVMWSFVWRVEHVLVVSMLSYCCVRFVFDSVLQYD
jgi:hypothetical protein